jgi:hypothetical protein
MPTLGWERDEIESDQISPLHSIFPQEKRVASLWICFERQVEFLSFLSLFTSIHVHFQTIYNSLLAMVLGSFKSYQDRERERKTDQVDVKDLVSMLDVEESMQNWSRNVCTSWKINGFECFTFFQNILETLAFKSTWINGKQIRAGIL